MTSYTQPTLANHHAGIWTGKHVVKTAKKVGSKVSVKSLGLDGYIFAALAFLASPVLRAFNKVSGFDARATFTAWKTNRKTRILDERMWEYARHDERLMAEIMRATVDKRDAAQWTINK